MACLPWIEAPGEECRRPIGAGRNDFPLWPKGLCPALTLGKAAFDTPPVQRPPTVGEQRTIEEGPSAGAGRHSHRSSNSSLAHRRP